MKIDFFGIPMEVDYEFYKGEEQTYDYVGSADDVLIHSVEVGGVDITVLLDASVISDIECEILEQLNG